MGSSKDTEAKQKTYQVIKKFSNLFQEKIGSITCTNILGCDLSTPEGVDSFKQNKSLVKKCFQCVKTAAEILEEIL